MSTKRLSKQAQAITPLKNGNVQEGLNEFIEEEKAITNHSSKSIVDLKGQNDVGSKAQKIKDAITKLNQGESKDIKASQSSIKLDTKDDEVKNQEVHQAEKVLHSLLAQREKSSTKYKGRHQIDSQVDQAEVQKRVMELEQERKARDAKRAKYISENQQVIAQEEMIQKQKPKNDLMQVKLQHREQSERAIEEMRKKQEERQNKINEGNIKLKETLSTKPLFVNFTEKYEEKLGQELENRKKKLAEIREIAKPLKYMEIQKHIAQYEENKQKQQEQRLNQSESWTYHKPEFQSKLLEIYETELEKQSKASNIKQQNAFQILERRKFFAKIVSDNHKPKVDPVKEEEFKKLQERIFTKPREGLNKEEIHQKGNTDMKEVIEQVKLQALTSKQHIKSKRLRDENNNSQLSLSPVNRTLSTKYQVDKENISFQQEESIGGFYTGTSSNKKNKISFLNKSVSQSYLIGVNRSLEEQYFKEEPCTPNEQSKRVQYAQSEYRKQLGENYLESMKKQNILHSNKSYTEDFIGDEVTKLLETVVNKAPTKKIQVIKNILQPFDEKIERDNRILEVIGKDDLGRADLADRYISSIKAKLSVLDSVKQVLQEQNSEGVVKKKQKKIQKPLTISLLNQKYSFDQCKGSDKKTPQINNSISENKNNDKSISHADK